MTTLYFAVNIFLLLLCILPLVKNPHWIFRVPEFLKLQIFTLQIFLFIWTYFITEKNIGFWILLILHTVFLIDHVRIFIRYTPLFKKKKSAEDNPQEFSIISSNVLQFNKNYKEFQKLIFDYKPDIFITVESNSNWEIENRVLEKEYPFSRKVTLENTYGMHLYSKHKFEKVHTHFFVADDIPSIEAHFKLKNNNSFCVFAVHPPPPSPTEEETSEERDGDLLSVAKKVRENGTPTVVIGDFNTVSWSNTSKLFSKTSRLLDGRVGRGILASYHAKFFFLRLPLDLIFHAPEISIDELKILKDIGSDHFPIYCKLLINKTSAKAFCEVENLDQKEIEEVNEMIEDGKQASSDNRD